MVMVEIGAVLDLLHQMLFEITVFPNRLHPGLVARGVGNDRQLLEFLPDLREGFAAGFEMRLPLLARLGDPAVGGDEVLDLLVRVGRLGCGLPQRSARRGGDRGETPLVGLGVARDLGLPVGDAALPGGDEGLGTDGPLSAVGRDRARRFTGRRTGRRDP